VLLFLFFLLVDFIFVKSLWEYLSLYISCFDIFIHINVDDFVFKRETMNDITTLFLIIDMGKYIKNMERRTINK